jgi:hypothetical protein
MIKRIQRVYLKTVIASLERRRMIAATHDLGGCPL